MADTSGAGEGGGRVEARKCRIWDFIERRDQVPESESPLAVSHEVKRTGGGRDTSGVWWVLLSSK